MNIGSKFIAFFDDKNNVSVISESQDEQTFGNGCAIIRYRNLILRLDVDKSDIFALLNLSNTQDNAISVYDILKSLNLMPIDCRDAFDLENLALVIGGNYEAIVGALSTTEGRERARSDGTLSNRLWMDHVRKMSEMNLRKKGKRSRSFLELNRYEEKMSKKER
jgi:hypothetical protein